jgi:hypothetical protein
MEKTVVEKTKSDLMEDRIKFEGWVEFEMKSTVYFRNTVGKDEGVVIAYKFTADGGIMYEVIWSDKKTSPHYATELTKTKR